MPMQTSGKSEDVVRASSQKQDAASFQHVIGELTAQAEDSERRAVELRALAVRLSAVYANGNIKSRPAIQTDTPPPATPKRRPVRRRSSPALDADAKRTKAKLAQRARRARLKEAAPADIVKKNRGNGTHKRLNRQPPSGSPPMEPPPS